MLLLFPSVDDADDAGAPFDNSVLTAKNKRVRNLFRHQNNASRRGKMPKMNLVKVFNG